jgi:hypothetical protein
MNIASAFKDGELQQFMIEAQQNNWDSTPFEHYCGMSTKNKGGFGEVFVEKQLRLLGIEILPPLNPGHDRRADRITTEIKFSLANSPCCTKTGERLIVPDEFTFNHIACNKDWERFIFCGVNPSSDHNPSRIRIKKTHRLDIPEVRMYFMKKTDFVEYMNTENTNLFNKQQGGKNGGNDDYMLAGLNKFYRLIDLPFVKEVEGNW